RSKRDWSSDVCSSDLRFGDFLARFGRRSKQRHTVCTRDFFWPHAKQVARGAVGANEARFQIFVDVGDRCFVVEIAISPFAFAERSEERRVGKGGRGGV